MLSPKKTTAPKYDMKRENDVKEKVLQTSIELFLRKGFSGTTTSELVRLTGVSKGALYWYFKNKEDIVANILAKYRDEFLERTIREIDSWPGDFISKFKRFYKVTTEFARDNRGLLLVYTALLIEFTGSGSDLEKEILAINDRNIMIIQKMIEDGIKDGNLSKKIDPVIYSRVIHSTMTGSHIQWFTHLSSHEDDPDYNRKHALMQRDALLSIILSEDSPSQKRP